MDFLPFVENLAEKGAESMKDRKTYVDNDGVERCEKCNEPVLLLVKELGYVPHVCACERAKDAAEDEAYKRRKAAEAARRKVREAPLYDRSYSGITFDRDTSTCTEASRICRAYVEHFDELRKANSGLLLTGTVGTGKSFYAACIVNALIAEGIPALMFTAPRLLAAMQKDGKAVCDVLNAFPLLVLDDLGAERGTDYAAELLESFIDSRYMAGKPLIITTNLSAREMQNCADMRYRRIYDRVKAMCAVPVILTGESRRAEQQRQKAQQAREIMGI